MGVDGWVDKLTVGVIGEVILLGASWCKEDLSLDTYFLVYGSLLLEDFAVVLFVLALTMAAASRHVGGLRHLGGMMMLEERRGVEGEWWNMCWWKQWKIIVDTGDTTYLVNMLNTWHTTKICFMQVTLYYVITFCSDIYLYNLCTSDKNKYFLIGVVIYRYDYNLSVNNNPNQCSGEWMTVLLPEKYLKLSHTFEVV